MKQNKGFTLIELLVVVAIIGILASVVLASLNSARGKGTDSAIKGELSSMRAQAEIIYDSNGTYGIGTSPAAFTLGPCQATTDTLFADSVMQKLWTSIDSRNGTPTATSGNTECASTLSAWAVAADLTQGGSWCVDSSGSSVKNPGVATAAIDGANAICNSI